MRRTAATALVQEGIDIKTAQVRLGHFSGDAILCGGVADQAS
ncbi:MAG: hypothetical protein ACRDOE_04530 [Streptosporangiaceae bacterium]